MTAIAHARNVLGPQRCINANPDIFMLVSLMLLLHQAADVCMHTTVALRCAVCVMWHTVFGCLPKNPFVLTCSTHTPANPSCYWMYQYFLITAFVQNDIEN